MCQHDQEESAGLDQHPGGDQPYPSQMIGQSAGVELDEPPDRRIDRRQQAHLADRQPGQGDLVPTPPGPVGATALRTGRYRWLWRDLYGRPGSLKPWEMNEPLWRSEARLSRTSRSNHYG